MAKMKTKPYSKIDWDKVDNMCAIQCTGEEIAGVLDIDYDTLNSACKREKGVRFSEHFKQKSGAGKMSLRKSNHARMARKELGWTN